MRKIICISAAVMCVMLSGCYSGNEPNDIAYITAVGVDKAEDEGNYNFTIQFAKPSQISGGSSEEGGKGGEIIEHITIEAPSIYSGITLADRIISKKFSLSHASLMVFSEDVAKDDITDFIMTLGRDQEVRPEMYLAVAQESAKKFLSSVEPVIEINPVRYYRLIFTGNTSSVITKTNINTFHDNLISFGTDSIVPVAGVMQESEEGGESSGGSESGESSDSGGAKQNKEADSPNEKQKQAEPNCGEFDYKVKNYTAGEIAINESNKSQIAGGAVFSKGRLAGYLKSIDVKAISMVTDEFESNNITFPAPYKDTPLTARIEAEKAPEIDVDISGDVPKIHIKLNLVGSFPEPPYRFEEDEVVHEFEQNVKRIISGQIYETLKKTQEMGADICGFGRYAAKHISYDDMNEYNWSEKYKNAEITVDTDFRVKHMGV